MKTLDFIKTLLHISKTTEPINNKSDYTRVKKWVKRATKLYIAFTIIAIIITVLFSNASSMLLDEFSTMDELSEGIAILAKIVMLFVGLYMMVYPFAGFGWPLGLPGLSRDPKRFPRF